MSNFKKTHSGIRQNDHSVKKSQKHETNLQKNSTLYFQVGLILCLLASYGLFEMKFETKIPPKVIYDQPIEVDYVFNARFKPEEVKKQEVKRKSKPLAVLVDPIIREDGDIKETELLEPVESTSEFNPKSLEGLPEEPTEEPMVDFILIEQVPLYPGCENKKGRKAQSKCMSDKINKLIQRKFDVGLADRLGLSGKQKIQVQFKISKTGEVSVMRTRAPHPMLEKEAERIVGLIPDMQPGKQRDKAVSVKFNLPINFMVQD